MPLNREEIRTLREAIYAYDFPKVTFDFEARKEVPHCTMKLLEASIQDSLLSTDIGRIRDGLSNVLYWGFAHDDRRDFRVERFRGKVTEKKLGDARNLFSSLSGPGLREIKGLELPEFSMMPFVSKIRMFLDPLSYVVLDNKLMELKTQEPKTIFARISKGEKETTIRITDKNEHCYEEWSRSCREIASNYFSQDSLRAVDVERGIFRLVEKKKHQQALEILSHA